MNIQPPEWLNEDAKKVFIVIAKHMGKARLESDDDAIADYAAAYVDVIRLEKAVAFEGDTLVGRMGNSYINPTLSILMARRKDLTQLRHDLRLTPRARNAAIKPVSNSRLKDAMSS